MRSIFFKLLIITSCMGSCVHIPLYGLNFQYNDNEVMDLVFLCENNSEGWPGLHWAIAKVKREDVAQKVMELYPEEITLRTPESAIWVTTGDWASERNYIWGYNSGYSALELAIKNDQAEIAIELLHRGVDPNDKRLERDIWRPDVWTETSALGLAIEQRQKDVVAVLLEQGASLEKIYQQNDYRERPARSFDALTYALENFSDENVLKMLISQAMKIKNKPQQDILKEDLELFKKYSLGPDGIERPWPPLHHAFFLRDYEGAKRLIDLGAHYDHYPYPFRFKDSGEGPDPLDEIAWSYEDSRFLELLLEEGIFAERILLRSIEEGRLDILLKCVELKVASENAVFTALKQIDENIIQLLLENGYLVSDQAMEAAFNNDQASIIDIFAAYGAEIPEKFLNEEVLASKPALLKMLVKQGRNFDWEVLLLSAVRENSLPVVQIIVENGFIEEGIQEGMKLAIKLGRIEIYEYLRTF